MSHPGAFCNTAHTAHRKRGDKLRLQRDALKDAGCKKVLREKIGYLEYEQRAADLFFQVSYRLRESQPAQKDKPKRSIRSANRVSA